jgi:hypothetical protein
MTMITLSPQANLITHLCVVRKGFKDRTFGSHAGEFLGGEPSGDSQGAPLTLWSGTKIHENERESDNAGWAWPTSLRAAPIVRLRGNVETRRNISIVPPHNYTYPDPTRRRVY